MNVTTEQLRRIIELLRVDPMITPEQAREMVTATEESNHGS
ncbi:hypothetical protein [Nocardiopsis dassonvillei]|nr:hypothetical protein [Nocardiopsis dassonvillei]